MKYTPIIFVTVDICIFKKALNDELFLLLIKRKNEPFKNCWALPGGFVDLGEDIQDAALRELKEETSIEVAHLKQVGAYGRPDRDPRAHTLSVAYFGTVPYKSIAHAADDAKEVGWFGLDKLPELAFDHQEIINDAINRYLK